MSRRTPAASLRRSAEALEVTDVSPVKRKYELWLDMLIAALGAFATLIGGFGMYDLLLAPQPTGGTASIVDQGDYGRRQTSLLGSAVSYRGVELCPGREQVNILILGTDERHNRGRADTIMVVMLRKDTKRAAAISVPRDLKVYVPQHGYQKINSVHAYFGDKSGPRMMARAVEKILHIPVHYYLKTDVAQFSKLFNALGGLDLYVDRNMYYRDRRGGLSIDLKKGWHHLDGNEIEGFVRHRKDFRGRSSSDFERVQRQQYVLMELIRQRGNLATIRRLPDVVRALKDMIVTDMTSPELVALGLLAKEIDLDHTESRVVPTVPQAGGAYYLVLQPRKTQQMLKEVRAMLRGESRQEGLVPRGSDMLADRHRSSGG